jgi:hypothetical protein
MSCLDANAIAAIVRRELGRSGRRPRRSYMTGDPCGGQPACPPDLVSPQTKAAILGATRTQRISPVVAGLAAGANAADITIASVGFPMTLSVKDIVAADLTLGTGLGLDAVQVLGLVNGVERWRFNGGVFSRGNANACTTACGYSVCLWPGESLVIRVNNQSTLALLATALMNIDLWRSFAGEAGFDCPPCGDDGGSSDGGMNATTEG